MRDLHRNWTEELDAELQANMAAAIGHYFAEPVPRVCYPFGYSDVEEVYRYAEGLYSGKLFYPRYFTYQNGNLYLGPTEYQVANYGLTVPNKRILGYDTKSLTDPNIDAVSGPRRS